MPESNQVRSMFATIARRYDLANHLLSFGMDFVWRHRLVSAVARSHPASVLDLATGSGDVAYALKKALGPSVAVTGLDFCAPMLAEAEKKKSGRGPLYEAIHFVEGDCLDLPFEESSFDAITIAFGLRNLQDRERGLQEMLRVLRKPDGRLYVLEFSQPDKWIAPFYRLHLHGTLPLMARVVTGQGDAYRYLGSTIEAFPTKADLSQQIQHCGFRDVHAFGFTGSIAALHVATTSPCAE